MNIQFFILNNLKNCFYSYSELRKPDGATYIFVSDWVKTDSTPARVRYSDCLLL